MATKGRRPAEILKEIRNVECDKRAHGVLAQRMRDMLDEWCQSPMTTQAEREATRQLYVAIGTTQKNYETLHALLVRQYREAGGT